MKKNKWLKWLAIALGAVTLIGAVSAITHSDDKTQELKGRHYEAHLLDDTTGEVNENNNGGISTVDYYKISQLESIKIADDAEVEYYVNLYDKDKKFIQVDKHKDDLTDDAFLLYEDLGAVYFKVEIVDTNDDEISFFEKSALAREVKVTISKEETDSEDKESEEESVVADSSATSA